LFFLFPLLIIADNVKPPLMYNQELKEGWTFSQADKSGGVHGRYAVHKRATTDHDD